MKRFAILRATVCCLAALAVGMFAAARLPAADVDESELPVTLERAFTNVNITRPIVLTHAGDGTNRVFLASQLGTVYVFPNKDNAKPDVFLDISSRVVYKDKENEEGFLGLAFHPKYKENGEFFAYYTTRAEPRTSVISRFRVSKDNPNVADPDFEEELLRIAQPWWNHNGGTLVFGPDGYLYIALGDGGKANDEFKNGQNLSTLLGSVLRIDIDQKEAGKNYAIPKDNPFVGKSGARPEIYAYGMRNPWRMAFDRKTGDLWLADVGQDLWEEINIVTKGGNYGWSVREGLHPFPPTSTVEKPADMIDPIWEYHHTVGKSITGGHVYRGEKVPALQGKYLYADYVTGKVYALDYDATAKKVKGNHTIPGNILPVMSFGEDEQGEVYFMVVHGMITRFAPKK